MNLSLANAIAYWGTQPSLTSLVPASNVWVDLAGDASPLPYAVFTQLGERADWSTGGSFIGRMRFQIHVFALTLAQVDTVVNQVQRAYDWADVTTLGFGCRPENVVPRGEDAGAYSCVVEYTLLENKLWKPKVPGDGLASGSSVAAGVGAAVFRAFGLAQGSAGAVAVGLALRPTGSAFGASVAVGVGTALRPTVGVSLGSSVALGAGTALLPAVGLAAGSSVAAGAAKTLFLGAGTAQGDATAAAVASVNRIVLQGWGGTLIITQGFFPGP